MPLKKSLPVSWNAGIGVSAVEGLYQCTRLSLWSDPENVAVKIEPLCETTGGLSVIDAPDPLPPRMRLFTTPLVGSDGPAVGPPW